MRTKGEKKRVGRIQDESRTDADFEAGDVGKNELDKELRTETGFPARFSRNLRIKKSPGVSFLTQTGA